MSFFWFPSRAGAGRLPVTGTGSPIQDQVPGSGHKQLCRECVLFCQRLYQAAAGLRISPTSFAASYVAPVCRIIPTVAEIDFLIRLSDYEHIPELFSPEYHSGNNSYYDVYWAGGHYGYGGVPYTSEGGGHSYAFVDLTNATTLNANDYGNNQRLQKNNERFRTYMRCVYDEWYWGSQKYGNNGQPTTGNAATQWLGYIY